MFIYLTFSMAWKIYEKRSISLSSAIQRFAEHISPGVQSQHYRSTPPSTSLRNIRSFLTACQNHFWNKGEERWGTICQGSVEEEGLVTRPCLLQNRGRSSYAFTDTCSCSSWTSIKAQLLQNTLISWIVESTDVCSYVITGKVHQTAEKPSNVDAAAG